MRFSIIIPVYNQAEFLPDAIESALGQTVKCEVIVVDDGSTDTSLEVAKRYPVTVIHQKNKGLSSARNRGIKRAKGKYILPLDADDILLENCVEEMDLAAKTNDADIVSPSFKEFGIRNGVVLLNQIPSLDDFKEGNRIAYFSAFKKSVWTEVGGYNPNMKWGWEDYDFWINVFKRGHSLCLLSKVLVLYRTKEHSMINVANEHAEELYAQLQANHPTVWSS